MCVVLVYCLTLRMTIFEKFLLDDILLTFVNKTSRDKGGACASENSAIGYRQIEP